MAAMAAASSLVAGRVVSFTMTSQARELLPVLGRGRERREADLALELAVGPDRLVRHVPGEPGVAEALEQRDVAGLDGVQLQLRQPCELVLAESPRQGPAPVGTAHRLHERAHARSEEHTSELQSPCNLVCRLLLEKKKQK